jgi:hypothetical protein
VTDVKVLSGHPMLKQAAVVNIKLWKFHCDDCGYGEAFQHEFTVRFRLGDSDCNLGSSSTGYEFPKMVALTNSGPCINPIASK